MQARQYIFDLCKEQIEMEYVSFYIDFIHMEVYDFYVFVFDWFQFELWENTKENVTDFQTKKNINTNKRFVFQNLQPRIA